MMKGTHFLAATAALVAPVATLAHEQPQRGDEVAIPIPASGIRTWEAYSDRILYVMDRSRRWYRVELMRPCQGLQYQLGVGFDTRGFSRFDRTSAVVTQSQRCAVNSITRSDGPPASGEEPASS